MPDVPLGADWTIALSWLCVRFGCEFEVAHVDAHQVDGALEDLSDGAVATREGLLGERFLIGREDAAAGRGAGSEHAADHVAGGDLGTSVACEASDAQTGTATADPSRRNVVSNV